MSRRSTKNKQINKLYKKRIRNIVIVMAAIICLFIIYKFNFSTKSEIANKTQVKFKEFGAENIKTDEQTDLEIFVDEENKKYIILPETVNGYYAQKYYLEEIIEVKQEENTNTEILENNITNTLENNTITNEIKNEVVQETTNETIENTNTTNNENEITNTIELAENTVENQNTVSEEVNDENEEKNQNTTVENNTIANEITNNTVANTTTNTTTNTITEEVTNTVENNEIEEESTNEVIENVINTNTIIDNTQVENAITENTALENTNTVPVENNVITNEVISEEKEPEVIREKTYKQYLPGEKFYLPETEEVSFEVEYQTIDVNDKKLYRQEIISLTDESEIKVAGYIPAGFYLNIKTENIDEMNQLKSDVDGLEESEVLLAYDITITNGTENYEPKDYYQNVSVSISSPTKLEDKLIGSSIKMIHIDENLEENEIIFEQIPLSNKTTDTVECVADTFSTYLVLRMSQITDEYIIVDNLDADSNYYDGKRYTDNNAGTKQDIYKEADKVEVTVNYYSYNPNSNQTATIAGGIANVGNRQVSGDYHYFNVTFNLGNNTKYIDKNKEWAMEIPVPTGFNLEQTQAGLPDGITAEYASSTLTLKADNWLNWTESAKDANSNISLNADTLAVNLYFAQANNVTVDNINAISGIEIVTVEDLEGHISATERQRLITYKNYYYKDSSGNISFELIDNPYMDRPAGYGFDGWASNNSYTFSVEGDTKVQTLTTNTNGNTQLTIDLYANWQPANVIFVNANNGNNNNDGKTLNSQVRNWQTTSSRLEANAKTISNASNREVNIIVLTGGTLADDDCTFETNIANTVTSLYNGVDYREGSAVTVGHNITLDYDLQLDYLNITGSNNYTSDESTDTINRYIVGNAHNLRIGRGMTPLNDGGAKTTFAQIQGGPTSNVTRSYRVVVESGKYANIQVGRTAVRMSYNSDAVLVLGNDIDRINNQHTNLRVYNKIASKTYYGTVSSKTDGKPAYFMNIKSGQIGLDYFAVGNEDMAYTGIYVGGHGWTDADMADRVLLVEGGQISNIIGGLATDDDSTIKTCIYVKGGTIKNIVGGAGRSTTYADRTIQVTGGLVEYSVSGGSNGYLSSDSDGDSGELEGNTLVYIGGNAIIGNTLLDEDSELYYVKTGNVFGAGNGNDDADESGRVFSSHIIIDGNATINNNVYGGGNYGFVEPENSSASSNLKITYENHTNNLVSGEEYVISTGTSSGNYLTANGNNVNRSTLATNAEPSANGIWKLTSANGGYYIQNTSNNRYLNLNYRRGYAYPGMSNNAQVLYFEQGNNSNGRIYAIYGNTRYYLNISNGSFTTNGNNAYLYLLKYTVEDLSAETDTGNIVTTIDILGGTIDNDVHGGSNNNGIVGSVKINMLDGTVRGAIYGGSDNEGTIQENSTIDINGGTIGTDTTGDAVFAGGKGQGTVIRGKTVINIEDKNKTVNINGNIYGGSALGTVSGKSYVNVKDDISTTDKQLIIIGKVFGGGKGQNDEEANISAKNGNNTTVNIDGLTTNSAITVYGGCNIQGTINGNVLVKVGENAKTEVNEVYGGGESAVISTDTDSVNVYVYANATVTNVYGGGNNAGIDGTNETLPRAVYVQGATVTDSVFGGSNTSGTVYDSYVYCSNAANVTNIYGGGCGENTQVTISNIETKEKTTATYVYGGSEKGLINENTNVVMDDSTVDIAYGGGFEGIVTKDTNITAQNSTQIKSLYGGGNNAAVNGSTNVTVNNATVTEYVFGGGNLGAVAENTNVDIINNANVATTFGGGSIAIIGKSTYVYFEKSIGDYVYGGGQGSTATVVENTNIDMSESTINETIYGGGDLGNVESNTLITIAGSEIKNNVYGGGNNAIVIGLTNVNISENSTVTSVYGGGNKGNVNEGTTVYILNSQINQNVFGGGNSGRVEKATNVTIDQTNVDGNVFGGGQLENVNLATVVVQSQSSVNGLYGGGDQGEVVTDTNVKVMSASVRQNVYAGGNGADATTTGVPGKVGGNTNLTITDNSLIGNSAFGGGKGITAIVVGNSYVNVENSTITTDVYGGGDNGAVNSSTIVGITSGTIGKSAYAAGNGKNAVVTKNSYIYAEGNTTIGSNLFGGGNASETGDNSNDAWAIVDISGAQIGGNVYGGANSSVIKGNAIVNIGKDAISDFYAEMDEKIANSENAINNSNKKSEYEKGKIDISGTVFGGGEQMVEGKEDYDFNSISVEGYIDINVDGNGYDTSNDDLIYIRKSIYGSGNASSARKNGDVTIKNYGTLNNPKVADSIQRCGTLVIDNSSMRIFGVQDSTDFSEPKHFSLNIIELLKLKNSSTLYLDSGANCLANYESLYDDENGVEQYNTVTIKNNVYDIDNNLIYIVDGNKFCDKNGNVIAYIAGCNTYYNNEDCTELIDADTQEEINELTSQAEKVVTESVEQDTENRIYMYSGKNLNISPESDEKMYTNPGTVKGMTFFGIFKEGNTDSGLYTGIFASDYTVGGQIAWEERDFLSSYVMGFHYKDPEHNILKDGFYTNYEDLGPEYENYQEIVETGYNATSYTTVITPTPPKGEYYRWYAKPSEKVYRFELDLIASKFSTFGTKEQQLVFDEMYPDAQITIINVEAQSKNRYGLYEKNTIPNVNESADAALENFALTMKTGNTGWKLNGETNFYLDPDTKECSYDGTSEFEIESANTIPTLSFYLFNSNNIEEERELGTYTITMNMEYMIDALNKDRATIIIEINLQTKLYDDQKGYNAAITPGPQYDIFSSTVTNITNKSSFSTFFELAQEDFMEQEFVSGNYVKDYYEDSYRVLRTRGYVFPKGTTITMIDRTIVNNPKYYYYNVTQKDVDDKKTEFLFANFLKMGSIDEEYDETEERKNYYTNDEQRGIIDYQYESFIFIFDFENAEFAGLDESLDIQELVSKESIGMALKTTVAGTDRDMFTILDSQAEKDMYFGVYKAESTINVKGELSRKKIYLGNEVELNVSTIYDMAKANSGATIIFDSRYFDKKLGIKISFYEVGTNGAANRLLKGSDLLGIYFELNGEKYYPRTDGTTRIKIAEKVSNASSTIIINTDNCSLESKNYYIIIESFGSADGIYYGINASAVSPKIEFEIINDIYGLRATLPDAQVIIDSKTGHTLDDSEEKLGYVSEDNNTLKVDLNYSSGLANPYLTVSLYRRDYNGIYDMTYTRVDLADYINETLEPVDVDEDTEEDKYIYKAYNTDEILKYIDNLGVDDTETVTFNPTYTLKEEVTDEDGNIIGLTTGTYKLVFSLYDLNTVKKVVPVEDEVNNTVIYDYQDVTEYEFIGDAFSYIVIK